MAPKKPNLVKKACPPPGPFDHLPCLEQGICNAFFDKDWGDLTLEFNVAGYKSQSVSVKYHPEARAITITAAAGESGFGAERLFKTFGAEDLFIDFTLPVDSAAPRVSMENGILSIISSKILHDHERDEAGYVSLPIDFF